MRIIENKQTETEVVLKVELDDTRYSGQEWHFFFKVTCNSPACPCSSLSVTAKVYKAGETESVDSGHDDAEIHFELDPAIKKIIREGGPNDDLKENPVTDLFVAEITEALWYQLYQFVHTTKNRNYHGIRDFDALNLNFAPYQTDIDESVCIPYRDFFPYCDDLRLHFNGQEYLLYDQYCVNPSCNCSETIISFYPVRPSGGDRSIAAVNYNYKTNDYSFEYRKDEESSDIVKQIMKDQHAEFPGIIKIFKKRHQILRDLYKKYKRKSQPELPIERLPQAGKKTGRNDPCPCGSGKKYKKCCGK